MTSKERHEARYQRRKAAREQKKLEMTQGCDDYEAVFTFDNLYRSFYDCRRGVRWKFSVKDYNVNHLKYTWMLYKEMQGVGGREYRFRGHNKFILVERGKARKISANKLPDRVIFHCFCEHSLTPMLTRGLIYDNAASQKGKGTSHTRRRLLRDLLWAYRKWGRDFYIAITDCKGYFDSLRHDEIEKIIRKLYTDERLIEFAVYCLQFDGINGVGVGLGCQPNQVYAIAYQNRTDHKISDICKYKRYMDDSIMIDHERETLENAVNMMIEENGKIGVSLHEEKIQIIPATHAFTFLKTTYRLLDDSTVIRKPWKKNTMRTRRRIKLFPALVDSNEMTRKEVTDYMKSYEGSMRGFNAYKTVQTTKALYNKLFAEGSE